jgi:hypothetical protein
MVKSINSRQDVFWTSWLTMAFWVISSLADEISAQTVSARAQGRVAELIQNALGLYRDEDDFKSATNSSESSQSAARPRLTPTSDSSHAWCIQQ